MKYRNQQGDRLNNVEHSQNQYVSIDDSSNK